MSIYILRFLMTPATMPPRAYVSRQLAEKHGQMHSPLHVIDELEVCQQDPLCEAVSAMRRFCEIETQGTHP